MPKRTHKEIFEDEKGRYYFTKSKIRLRVCIGVNEDGSLCTNQMTKGQLCTKHGGIRIIKPKGKCTHVDNEGKRCVNKIINSGLCKRHGAKKKYCTHIDENGIKCQNLEKARGLCNSHGAPRPKCTHIDDNGKKCTNNRINNGVCNKHGANRLFCTAINEDGTPCTKISIQNKVCVFHGAFTPRCIAKLEDGSSCTNRAVNNKLCFRHGALESRCVCGNVKYRCKKCNILGAIAHSVRTSINGALKKSKNRGSNEYLGCDYAFFKVWIEMQFKKNMSWTNYGKEWHIDHRVPLRFKGDGEVDEKKLIERLHYRNTQPLWAKENISKGNRFIT